MAVRLQVPRNLAVLQKALKPYVKIALLSVLGLGLIVFGILAYYYSKYSKITDEKLARGPFPEPSLLYAAPEPVMVGDAGTPPEIALHLRQSGYSEDARTSRMGWYHLRSDAIEIFPGPDSYFEPEPGVIRFKDDKISDIISLRDNSPLTEYDLEPEVLSNLFNKSREKHRIVRFADMPPVLVNAVISAEDKRFYQHSGFDPIRIVKALLVDLREMRWAEGASTITQQLARMVWLSQKKTLSRKFPELLITIHLEQKLSKHQIFEFYANHVDLGRRGSFGISGFGEASQAYFGKDISQLTLPQAATLAGLIQRPSYRNPVRWPERAKSRRNVVLMMMRQDGYITESQYKAAVAAPLVLAKTGPESSDAPYFVDIVNKRLQDNFEDRDFNDTGYKVYTTLDLDLQRDALEAVDTGFKEIQKSILRRTKKGTEPAYPQVALIALDPATGEVKALVGGLNYGTSQLNHALAERPSGSVFKPLVYATALSSGLNPTNPNIITPSTIFPDEPRSFDQPSGKPYEPSNYKDEFFGQVPVRMALSKSLNVPTVEIAETAGYTNVADLAHRVGLEKIQPTPAMALGAYDVTPLQMAGAYTMFANKGVYVSPRFVESIHDHAGQDVYVARPDAKAILDPRVNFLMVNLMEEVLNSGTGGGVRARGFTLPAAGKTGTSHDGWFAGFTSKLLCVVWVGYDDYRDLKMEGAHSALPIWTNFMKRAHTHREYRNAGGFDVPNGVVSVQIDPDTGELATTACPKIISEYYLTGTQPTQFCHLHNNGATQFADWRTNPALNGSANGNVPPYNPQNPNAPAPVQNPAAVPNAQNPNAGNQPQGEQKPPEKDKKKGFFDKLKGIFR